MAGERSQAPVSKIFGRTLPVEFARRATVWRPEASAGHFHHLDIVRLESLVDRRDFRQSGKTERLVQLGLESR
jgi:hypothetical protein